MTSMWGTLGHVEAQRLDSLRRVFGQPRSQRFGLLFLLAQPGTTLASLSSRCLDDHGSKGRGGAITDAEQRGPGKVQASSRDTSEKPARRQSASLRTITAF